MTETQPDETPQPDEIQLNLSRRLEAYRLNDRVSFDESALEELRKISHGEWRLAEQYAGVAVRDALRDQKSVVTGEDVEKAISNLGEIIALMTGGQDIWDQVRYVGTQAPTMAPGGIQFRGALALWDADRARDAMNAIRERRLPQYALPDLVQYDEKGLYGPVVGIPFKYDPSKDEVRAVAESVAHFVAQHTGKPQEVEDISQGGSDPSGFLGVQYFVRPQPEAGKDRLLYSPNYRIAKSFTSPFGTGNVQGVVRVSREILCDDRTTLEAYVQSLKRSE